MEHDVAKNGGVLDQCESVGKAGNGFAADELSCVKEVLIEQGNKTVSSPSTDKGTFRRLRADDKFRHRFLHTVCVCWIMVALGWRIGLVGPTFPDLRLIIREDLTTASWIFTAISLGGLIGAVCGGALYDRVNKTLLYVSVATIYGVVAAVTPWCSSFPAMFAAHTLHGGCASAIDAVVTTDMVNVWRMDAGPYLQAAHFAFTVGAIISPFATKPFLAKRLQHFIDQDNSRNDTTIMLPSSLPGYYPASNSSVTTLTSDFNYTSSDVLERFGETKIYVTYFVSTAVSLSAAAVFIMLNCRFGSVYGSIEECIGSQGKLNRRVYTLSKSWKISLTILVAVLLMLYCMNERNFSGFLMTFAITGLGWTKADGATATSVFWAAFACGRFSGIYVVKFLSISSVLELYIGILSVGTICLWLSVIYGIDILVWISVAIIGLGMSVIFASTFAWLSEKVRRLTGTITSIVFVFLSTGSMVMPILTGYLMEESSYIWFIYLQLILVIGISSLFLVIELTHRWLLRRQPTPEQEKCSNVEASVT